MVARALSVGEVCALPKGVVCGDPSGVVKGVTSHGGVPSKVASIKKDPIMVVE